MDFGFFGGLTPEQVQNMRAFMASHPHAQMGPFGGLGGGAAAAAFAGADTSNAGGTAEGAGANTQQPNSNPSGTDGAGAGEQGAGDRQGEPPVLNHNTHHNGVVCDVCSTEIRGFRYKCMQCPDFDLCAKCEHKGHHAGHIMMRIAFPEQAQSAIRRFMNPSPPPSPRHHGHHPFGGRHGHGHGHPGMSHPLFESGRRGGCRRRSGHDSDRSEEEEERPTTAPGCPYQMGKKEMKRWSKWMKKAAAHQHRSAVAYARAAAASGQDPTANANATTREGAQNDPAGYPMDFTAVASQIQEFLNYWGIPVDVVELYDQFGNRGQPTSPSTPADASATQGSTTGQTGANANATGTPENKDANTSTTTTGEQPPKSPAAAAAANLSENMEQMRIDENQGIFKVKGPREVSFLMDMEADVDNSGWTVINSQSREQSPGNSNVAAPITPQPVQPVTPVATGEPNGNQQAQASPQANSTPGSMNSSSDNTNSTPFASVGSNGQPATPSAPPAFPMGVPNVPLYPVLNQPQLQQILQGVSSAVNSVVRSIPIVSDPRGPFVTNVTPATPGQVPSAGPPSVPATGTETQPELDARSMKTLNQLLAMGFSNEGGYLTRLVLAKKGDLEAVLGSLFPN